MSETEEVQYSITADTEQAKDQFEGLIITVNEAQVALYGMLGILRRMGLSEDVTRAITDIQRLISIMNMLRASYLALMAASGPVGWALAGIGLAGSAVTAVGSVLSMLDREVRR